MTHPSIAKFVLLVCTGCWLGTSAALAQDAPVQQRSEPCAVAGQADSTLTRAELRQFLQLPRGASRSEITAILGEPYCQLPSSQVDLPDGTQATIDRVAYPFDFAPQTWFVVIYSGDRYLAFDYSFPDRPSPQQPDLSGSTR